jgi:hypothetical protein
MLEGIGQDLAMRVMNTRIACRYRLSHRYYVDIYRKHKDQVYRNSSGSDGVLVMGASGFMRTTRESLLGRIENKRIEIAS